MRSRIVLAVVALLTVVGGSAQAADWYFTRDDGARSVGPFKTYRACVLGRKAILDNHPDEEVRPCQSRHKGRAPVRLEVTRWTIGMVAGPGWTDRRPGGATTGTATAGVEAGLQLGGRRAGLELFGGVLGADASSEMENPRVILPLGIGFAVQPGGRRVRADLGVGGLFAFASGCVECSLGGGVRARAGVNVWLRPSLGIAVDAIAQYIALGDYSDHGFHGPVGHSFEAPNLAVRVSLLSAVW